MNDDRRTTNDERRTTNEENRNLQSAIYNLQSAILEGVYGGVRGLSIARMSQAWGGMGASVQAAALPNREARTVRLWVSISRDRQLHLNMFICA
jgi:hypothetical protein